MLVGWLMVNGYGYKKKWLSQFDISVKPVYSLLYYYYIQYYSQLSMNKTQST